VSHFRPISVQPFLALLTEKCVRKQLTEYINEQNILYPGQFGFRRSHSCDIAMTALLEFIYREIDKGNVCILVSLDLAKAFDTIIREFLLEKLTWYGIDPKWFRSYMSYRCQFVKDQDGNRSEIKFTVRGTCQGSSLGALIFTMYINDLPLVIRNCICILFADDTQICVSGSPKNLPTLVDKITEDLKSIINWMTLNGMQLNVEKTQLILLGNAVNVSRIGQITINIDGKTIQSSDTIKSLGLTIDAELKWLTHINKLSRSYHLTAKSLYPLKRILSTDNFIKIFNACVLSLCNFMSIIWGTASKSSLKIIEKNIRTSARIILGKRKYDPIKDDIYGRLGWFLPKDSYDYSALCLIFKITKTEEIPYFRNTLKYRHEIHSHQTRNKGDLNANFIPRNSYGKKSIFINACNIWKELPDEISNAASIITFKSNLKSFILQRMRTSSTS